MADTKNLIFLDLTGLAQYDAKIKNYINSADALSLKGLALSEDGKKLLAFKDLPIEGATAAYEIELPETDLSGLIEKFTAATAGNVITVAEDGKTIVDSGVALADLATKAEVAEVQADADAAMAAAEAITALVGVIPEGYEAQTVVAYIQEVAANIIANGYDDTELRERVTDLEEAVETLNADVTVEGSVDFKVATEIAKIVADAPESLNDLKEISTWISTHETDAAGMNLAIQQNKTAIDALDAYVGELPEGATATTVVGYIAEALTNSNLDQYAKAADLVTAIERIAANEQAIALINASLAEGGVTYNAIAEAKAAGENAQAAVDNLAAYVGVFASDDESVKTLVQYVDAKAAKVAADIEARLAGVEAGVAENKSAIEALATKHDEDKAALEASISENTAAIAENKAVIDGIGAISEEDINGLFE